MEDALYYLGCIVAMGVVFWWMKSSKRRQTARAAPQRSAQAATRGWRHETDGTTMFAIERWRGSTDGLPWTLETLTGGGSTEDGRRQSVTRLTRWQAELPLPMHGAACLLREFDDDRAPSLDEKDFAALGGFLGKLAKHALNQVHALAFDVMFGPMGRGLPGVEAWKPVAAIVRERPDDRVLAEHPAADAPRLEAALDAMGRTLDDAPLSVTSRLPSLLLRPQGVALSVKERLTDLDDLARLVHAGVAAARAAATPR